MGGYFNWYYKYDVNGVKKVCFLFKYRMKMFVIFIIYIFFYFFVINIFLVNVFICKW